MRKELDVTHVILNNLGGITSLVQNLILFKGDIALPQNVVVLDLSNNQNEKALLENEVKKLTQLFPLNPLDNWYTIYSNLANVLSKAEGVLVSNDQFDLIMLEAFNIPRKVVQLVHDPYNVELSLKFHEVIDCFVAHSRYIFETLLEKLPHRVKDIIYLPYGIPLQQLSERKLNTENPLKMVFVGRHDKAKGVFDLYEIDQNLKEKNILVEWLILGKGPETKRLKAQWQNHRHVDFVTPTSFKDVISAINSTDVMVFPTKFEGFPVALLECMSQGCVPVVSDLPGGIRELVVDGENGFKCAINNNEDFSDAIVKLHHNRQMLLNLQKNAVQTISEKYNAVHQSKLYQQLFHSIANSDKEPRHHTINRKIGSRLDHPYFPSFLVRNLRKLMRKL